MSILVLGDVHAPFIDKVAFSKVLRFLESLNTKPDYIVQVGDLYDFFSFSNFPRNPDLFTPKEEVISARLCAEEIWRCLKKRAPKAECYQLLGNHSTRLHKRLLEKFPEVSSLVDFSHLWKFNGVNTITDPREELSIKDILFIHGFKTKLGDHAKYFRKRTVCGHSHRGGVAFLPEFGKDLIWELNAGFLACPEDYEALKYTPHKFTNWTKGLGFIDEFGPRFIAF